MRERGARVLGGLYMWAEGMIGWFCGICVCVVEMRLGEESDGSNGRIVWTINKDDEGQKNRRFLV